MLVVVARLRQLPLRIRSSEQPPRQQSTLTAFRLAAARNRHRMHEDSCRCLDSVGRLLHQPRYFDNDSFSFLRENNLRNPSFCFFDIFAIHSSNMSSSIAIPSRTPYGESSKAGGVDPSSSSSSSYSSSPRTPQQPRSPATPSSNKYGHDRRPSLLS